VASIGEAMAQFEMKENNLRGALKGVFANGIFKASTMDKLVRLEFNEFAESIIGELKCWSKETTERVSLHNKELQEIADDVLMTYEDMLKKSTEQLNTQHAQEMEELRKQLEDQKNALTDALKKMEEKFNAAQA